MIRNAALTIAILAMFSLPFAKGQDIEAVRPFGFLDSSSIEEILLFQYTQGGGPYVAVRSIRDRAVLQQIGKELSEARLRIEMPVSPTPSTGVVIFSRSREVLVAAASFGWGQYFLIRDAVWSEGRWTLVRPPDHRYLPENEREKGIILGRKGQEGFLSKTLTEQVRAFVKEE